MIGFVPAFKELVHASLARLVAVAALPSLVLTPATLIGAEVHPALQWPAITREQRPWAYNWWMGSAVDTNNLARELKRYREAGLGGIHVIPIYGAKGFEARYLEYLSPQWLEMLRFTVNEATLLDLGVDMTTGAGWCFGGPQVPKTDGGWRLRTSVLEVQPGQSLTNKLSPGALLGLVAQTADGKQVNLREKVRADGTVDWRAEGRGVKVYVVTAEPGGPMVKRAGPGGQGPMINPFSHQAMTNFLQRFTGAFENYHGVRPRAMYHDSYEYNSSWTPDLLDEFARRRGYRLEDQWPAFCGDPRSDERTARVRCDFQETLSDLMVEKVFPEWVQWSHARKMLTRNQAHGSPGNLLDLYALADIPETEMFGRGTRDPLRSQYDGRFLEGDRNPLISKFASSAAHTAGRKLVSAETGTWMAEHFCGTLEELKCLVDLLFVSGVNHVIYHGTCYSPDDAPWPGWLFYASTQMNPRNAIWRDAPVLNEYIARCQSLLQSGQPDNDVLLYWPLHDLWQSSPGPVTPMTVHNHQWLTGQPVGATAKYLWEHGYMFDYVSDRQLMPAKVGGIIGFQPTVQLSNSFYRVVLVPRTKHMPLPTLRHLLNLAEQGANILFEEQLPQDVPGAADLAVRRSELKQLLPRFEFQAGGRQFQQTKLGKGRVLVGDLATILAAAKVPRETICDQPGVRVIRRYDPDSRRRVYFIANQGTNVLDGMFPLGKSTTDAIIMDPITGRTGVAVSRNKGGGNLDLRLRLEPGQSVFVRAYEFSGLLLINGEIERAFQGANDYAWLAPDQTKATLLGPWQIEFLQGGPVLPKAYQTAALASWTTNGDPETERFAGTAVYRTEFNAPAGQGPWLLDLGKVCHSARVRLNGAEIGRLIMPPYRLSVPALRAGRNQLEIEVTNLSANRIRDLDRRKVAWRNFNDINLVNINYKGFDAANWPVMDSGLLGPVVLQSAAKNNQP